MIKMSVAGSPIGHSLSPLLHSTAYKLLGIDAEFLSEEITEDKFGDYYFNAKRFRYLALVELRGRQLGRLRELVLK